MYCQRCGAKLPEGKKFCADCGASVDRFNNQNNANGRQETNTCDLFNAYYDNPKNSSGANGMAIAGFVCSFFFPILGWIFGGIGLSRSFKSDGKGRGFSIAAIAISSALFVIGLILNILVLVLFV